MPRKKKKTQTEKSIWKVGVYCRLSSEDGDNAESDSIGNQRQIIQDFLKNEDNVVIVDYYSDDGYSGTTFNRPEFKRLFNALTNGDINTIIVKDLSRFGRNYIEVGNYIEQIFPLYNIRFIAINDNIDSYKDPKSINNIIVPFKNLMNDEYARDISQKVRSVLDSKKGQGKFIGSYAPYGYLRDPKDKYKFIIDKEPAKIVKKIFSMILSGKSKKEIANELNSLQISTPRVYKLENGITHYNINDSTKLWNSKKLDEILKNKTYTGDLIQGVRKKVSHKVHKTNRVNSDEWIIIPNHHKGIISLKDYNKVQELLYERNIRVNSNNNYDVFSGYLRCGKCGSNMIIRKGQYHTYYYCRNYLKDKKCSVKSIQKEKLESLVIDFINNFRNVVIEIDQKIEQIVSQKEISYDIDIIKAKIDNIDNEINKFVKLRNEIKDDLKEKFITEAEYWEYSADYSKKISEYRKEKINLEDRLENISFESKNNEDCFNEIKKLKEVKKIDRLLIEELIEDIVIDENQNLKIIFKCEDKYFEALDFIKRQNYDIILSS